MLAVIISLFSFLPWQGSPSPGLPAVKVDTVRKIQHHRNTVTDSTGRFLKINRIVLVGNRITRDPIVLRELSVKSGDIVHSSDLQSLLDVDKKKLINTRLFNTVELKTLQFHGDQVDLIVNLSERWYTFPSPIFELADRNFNEWWQNYDHDFRRVNYGLRLYQFNMRGRNETLRLVAQLGFYRKFEINYKIPYFDKKQKQGLILDFDYSETKNLPYRTVDHKLEFIQDDHIVRVHRGGFIAYTYRNSFYDQHTLKGEFSRNTIADTLVAINPNYFVEGERLQEYGTLSYQFVSDHRDYFGYPLNGYYFNAMVSKSGVFRNDDVNKFEVSASYAKFAELGEKFFFSNNTIGYWSTPEKQPYNAFGAMGYKKQFIRGYEVYVIEGPMYFLNKSTFKKRIFSKTYDWKSAIKQFRHVPISLYLKMYGDFGYVQNYKIYEDRNLNTRLSNRFLTGAGFGLDLVGSYDAVIRFEYSFNATGNSGFFIHIKREF
jgi:outer membrane protein assembly factor BamA